KRGFFKIASHILENHRLLLRSCFLNAVDKVVKTSGSSDDNKKEFFETAPHVLKNSGLFQGADV
ncbi:hypothetical protein, partial [Enterococcus hirae]|uniref:hypothetical protein n=1 Tax=Enterococcus hirae TaxID=1354 RepID=UPI001964B022